MITEKQFKAQFDKCVGVFNDQQTSRELALDLADKPHSAWTVADRIGLMAGSIGTLITEGDQMKQILSITQATIKILIQRIEGLERVIAANNYTWTPPAKDDVQ